MTGGDGSVRPGKAGPSLRVNLVPSFKVLAPGDSAEAPMVPLGLLSVATTLRLAGVDVNIVVPSPVTIGALEPVVERLLHGDPDVVGFTTVCDSFHVVLKLARLCKAADPGVCLVLGGPQVSAVATETVAAFPFVDLVVRGECEDTIAEVFGSLSSRRSLRDLPGLTFPDGQELVATPDAQPVADLDRLPSPDYTLYPCTAALRRASVEAGRGCPYRCAFCTRHAAGGPLRYYSVERVVDVAKRLRDVHGFTQFDLIQDGLTASRSWVMALCDAWERELAGATWTASSRADCLDEELCDRMLASGCDGVFLGLETGSQSLQTAIGKRLQVDEIVPAVQLLTGRGIRAVTSLMAGFPEETWADLSTTANLMVRLRYGAGAALVTQQVHLLAPLASSPLFEEHRAALALDEFWSDLTTAAVDADDLELARRHPVLFSMLHHFPTRHLPRQVVVRVPFLLKNLLYFEYGLFLLWQDETLGFPDAFLRSPALLALPGEQADRGVGELESLRQVVSFVEAVLAERGLLPHAVTDVMRYDLALRTMQLTGSESSSLAEDYSWDVGGFVKTLQTGGFRELPAVRPGRQRVLFRKREKRIATFILESGPALPGREPASGGDPAAVWGPVTRSLGGDDGNRVRQPDS